MELLAVLLCVLVVVAPILAILAFTRVQRLTEQVRAARLQDLVARVYALERLTGMERAPDATGAAQTSPSSTAEPTPTTPTMHTPIAIPSPRPIPPIPSRKPAQESPNPREAVLSATSDFGKPSVSLSSDQTSYPPDLETRIAGRWFNRVGILTLIIAVSFFLKYAFDNDWIGPSGRVAIGILLGAGMLPWSQWLLGKGYSYFSEGIGALGHATLLLSVWAGCRYYSLFSREVGLAGMIVVTAVMSAVALGRNSERIALLSLLGGFVSPLLVSAGKDEEFVLFTYLLILGGSLLIIAARRDWRFLAPVSFVLTQVYFWGWYESFYRSASLERTIIFATLFFLLYLALPVLRTMRFSSLDAAGIFVVLVNSFAYLGALYAMLWPQDRWPLTLLVLALSAGHLAVARFVPSKKAAEWPVTQQLFAGLALTFVTLAIPIRLEGKWITLALAVEGAILVRTGFQALLPLLRHAGLFLLALAALRALFLPLPAQPFLLNERFATYVGVIVCMGVVLFTARKHGASASRSETKALGVLAVAINLYALVALSLEFWDYFGHAVWLGIDSGLAQHLALSLLWTVYASALVMTGMKHRAPLLRWQALVLFALVVTKVFLHDSSYLQRFYRIISFLILGLVLLIVSFLYQSKASRERPS
jgi:uncharacterized membrane protein